MPVYRQIYAPFSHSLGLSSIFAALPLITLFVLLEVDPVFVELEVAVPRLMPASR